MRLILQKRRIVMKRKFDVVDVCCANCAAKMEADIKKIDGVNDVKLNFLTQKIIIDADDERFDDIVKQTDQCIRKIEPDAYIEF